MVRGSEGEVVLLQHFVGTSCVSAIYKSSTGQCNTDDILQLPSANELFGKPYQRRILIRLSRLHSWTHLLKRFFYGAGFPKEKYYRKNEAYADLLVLIKIEV